MVSREEEPPYTSHHGAREISTCKIKKYKKAKSFKWMDKERHTGRGGEKERHTWRGGEKERHTGTSGEKELHTGRGGEKERHTGRESNFRVIIYCL